MGTYNPHLPYILGEEWVPIRDEDLVFSPSVNVVELGHTFGLDTSRQVRDARFYTHELSPESSGFQCGQMAIYPSGTEELTGPIQQVLIPATTIGVTGSNISGANGSIFATYSGAFQEAAVFFATNGYPHLSGKRILNVSLMYAGYVIDTDANSNNIPFVDPDPITPITNLYIRNDSASTSISFSRYAVANTGALWQLNTAINPASNFAGVPSPGSVNFGDVVPFALTGIGTSERLPWTYPDLQRFEASAGSRLHAHFLFQIPSTNPSVNNCQVFVTSLFLRVIYCEEQRVVIGGKLISPYVLGANIVTMRSLARAADPVLSAGTYSAVMSWVNPGDIDFGLATSSGFPELNALRELYDIPTHQGVQVNVPFPLEDHIGDTFTAEQIHVLPQLSLHTSGGPLTEPHVYGRQAAAHVYSTIIASQEILVTGSVGGQAWQQARYYARRYGNTTVPLLLFSPDATISGASNQITLTPGEWDALPEIIDRWKEVTKPFPVAPVMPNGQVRWRWSATGETAGNRWEVLGAIAPAISGIPGNSLNKVPAPNQLSLATYGAPSLGDSTNLGWAPGYSPFVTTTTDDQTADAVLMFSQDPPTITGFAINLQSQSVTGFTECTHGPCCLPSAIQYHRVTWSPTTLPTTGFGAYELQRQDVVDATWQTIMLATSPAVTGFNDYEARVGVLSSYQIRQLNVLDFAGQWSVTGTGTVTAPGVTLPSCGSSKRGVLIFTSNESQAGAYNLAYAMTWDESPVESFDFPEASAVQFTTQHDRDYQVAFHGSERGGETFTRRLLLANAAIALPRLANVRSLRDMAWADLPYVCVRDDIGNRWLAAVIVPHDDVRRNRRLYNAEITVVEVTATPSPVDP